MAPGILPIPIRMRRVCYSHQSDCAGSVACTSQTRQCMYVVRTNQIALKGLVISTTLFFTSTKELLPKLIENPFWV